MMRTHARHWAYRYVTEGWQYVDTDPPTRDFAGRRGDCWTFVMAVEREQFGRELPDVSGYGSSQDYDSVADVAMGVREFGVEVPFGHERPGDVAVLRVEHGWPIHPAVVTEPGRAMHLCQFGVYNESLRHGRWRGKVQAVYRPGDIACR